MSVIRGRIGQFRVLYEEPQLAEHLVRTVRLTKESFLTMLETEKAIILKPAVGLHFIKVYEQDEQYIIIATHTKHEVQSKALAYELVLQVKENQNYVMQPFTRTPLLWRRPYYRFLTLQKRAGAWEVTASTKVVPHSFDGVFFQLYSQKIRTVANVAAQVLQVAYPVTETIVLHISVDAMGNVIIHDSMLHFSVSKWSQYQQIKQFMPRTDLLTAASWSYFLQTCDTIFLKPCNGQQGRGILKVSKEGDQYIVHRGKTKKMMSKEQIESLFEWNEWYILQQGLPLCRLENCVFDVRVLVKKVEGIWQVRGRVVKVAGDGYIVTNAAKAILRLEDVPIVKGQVEVLHTRLDDLCLAAAQALDQQSERTIIGFDVAVTEAGELWIIEGNYMPDLAMFYELRPKDS